MNAGVRSKKAARRRAYLNYASWMSYLFGLVAFLVFPPSGILAIAGGILLSIAYYAVPDEHQLDPDTSAGDRVRNAFAAIFRLERVNLPIPHFPRLRLVLVGTPLLAGVIGYLVNFFILQRPMNDVLRQNTSLRGMRVSTHYLYWMVPGVLVYDLKNITEKHTRLDVHVALVEYAERLRSRRYSEIELLYRGQKKFSVAGAEFQRLGVEYEKRNYGFVLFDFPRSVAAASGASPARNATALIEFHDRWYAKDVMGGRIKPEPQPEEAAGTPRVVASDQARRRTAAP